MVFYLLHGAERVICIEADQKKFGRLRNNAKLAEKKFHAKVDVIRAHLDNIKVDIEGGEEGMVLEKHFAGYWKEIGHSDQGFPAPAKVYRLTKIKMVDNLLKEKELFFIWLLHPKAYKIVKARKTRIV